MKVLGAKYALITCIAKGTVMAHSSRYCLDMEAITDLGDEWIRNILSKLETK